MSNRYAVIGGGIVGAGVARRLTQVDEGAEVTILEKEAVLAAHQTGHNSGVVHAGLYYTPGSFKAILCRRGVHMLEEFCAEHGLAYVKCGKILAALDDEQRGRLGDIEDRARANGVPGIKRLDRDEISEIEPHVRAVAGLHSPSTAIVDYAAITRAMVTDAQAAGAVLHLDTEVTAVDQRADEVVVTSRAGDGASRSEAFDMVIACGGLHGDRLARMAGDDVEPQIMPFRGEYYRLRPERRSLVRGLIYPVPDPRYPFLGVHLTPRVDGEVLVGPNAILALAREGYGWGTISPRDLREVIASPAFRSFARQHWRTGAKEMVGSLSKRRFVAAARQYVPELEVADVLPGPSGIRAQAVDADGTLVDDFRINRRGRFVAVRNAPSPAATSSLAIAEHVVDQALERR